MARKKNNCKLFPYKRTELLSAQDVQQKSGWEITAFDLPSTWKHTQGEDVVVAVIDTGVDLSHQDLVKNLLPGKNFIDPKKDPIDDSGHGCVSKETLIHTNFLGITEIEYLYNYLNCQEETMLNEDGIFFIKNVEQINLKTLSLDSKNINPVVSKIEAVHKIPINREIINIELEGNINLKLTPWHPVYLIFNKNQEVYEIQRKRADEIEIGDHFVFPSNSNFDFLDSKTNENSVCEKQEYSKKCHLGGTPVKSINKEEYCGFFYDFTVKDYHNYIANGHFVSNTHVSGIICAENNDIGVVGVAPKTKIIPIKVLDKNGNGNLENVSKAIIWAADQKVDFITMSLGSPEKIDIVHNAIKYAISKKVVIFCAAGNAGNQRKIFYPAAYKEVIGIGAVDENFNLAGFSCTGPDLDFVAPGVEILSTVPNNWYAILSGTSMANPFVTGIACLLLSYKKKNNLDIKLETANDYIDILKQYTIPVSNPEFAGKRFFEGFGIIDPRKMEKWVKENTKAE